MREKFGAGRPASFFWSEPGSQDAGRKKETNPETLGRQGIQVCFLSRGTPAGRREQRQAQDRPPHETSIAEQRPEHKGGKRANGACRRAQFRAARRRETPTAQGFEAAHGTPGERARGVHRRPPGGAAAGTSWSKAILQINKTV